MEDINDYIRDIEVLDCYKCDYRQESYNDSNCGLYFIECGWTTDEMGPICPNCSNDLLK